MSEVAADRVHLLSATVDDASVQAAWRLLADDEAEHARAFGSVPARDRFVVGRGLVRSVLGHRLGVSPQSLGLRTEPDGKPQLAETAGKQLQFNLSHSGSMAVLAVTDARAVGVDVEELTRRVDIDAVARRQFTERECAMLADADDTRALFFELWVRKEALIKAVGTGFRVPTSTIEVGLDASVSTQGRGWMIRSFFIADGYVAAVAVQDGTRPLSIPDAAEMWGLLDDRR